MADLKVCTTSASLSAVGVSRGARNSNDARDAAPSSAAAVAPVHAPSGCQVEDFSKRGERFPFEDPKVPRRPPMLSTRLVNEQGICHAPITT